MRLSTASRGTLVGMPRPRLAGSMTSAGERAAGAVSARMALGRYGEELVARYLRERGMEVVARNWRCEHGEIDIVARDGPCLVVCEVKTRRGTAFGDPVEAVTVGKAMRLRRLAGAYVREQGGHRGPVRVDVVGVLCEDGRPPVLRHVRGVGS